MIVILTIFIIYIQNLFIIYI